jgi:hypothetical protein
MWSAAQSVGCSLGSWTGLDIIGQIILVLLIYPEISFEKNTCVANSEAVNTKAIKIKRNPENLFIWQGFYSAKWQSWVTNALRAPVTLFK